MFLPARIIIDIERQHRDNGFSCKKCQKEEARCDPRPRGTEDYRICCERPRRNTGSKEIGDKAGNPKTRSPAQVVTRGASGRRQAGCGPVRTARSHQP